MAFDGKRQEIADTLNAIDGIKGYIKKPATVRLGDAWSEYAGITIEDGVRYYNWTIYVTLASDVNAAMDWLEENQDELLDLLQYPEYPILSVGYIQSMEPVDLGVSTSPMYGLQISVRD